MFVHQGGINGGREGGRGATLNVHQGGKGEKMGRGATQNVWWVLCWQLFQTLSFTDQNLVEF